MGPRILLRGFASSTTHSLRQVWGNTDYKWQWKGGEYKGRNFDAFRNVFAIPTSDLIANKNLKLNNGYK